MALKPFRPGKKPPGYRYGQLKHGAISQANYDQLVAVYAKHDCVMTAVACELGWTRGRVKSVYTQGYPSKGLPSVQSLLARNKLAAEEIRAERERLDEELPPSEQIVATTPAAQAEEIAEKAVVINERENERLRMLIKRDEDRRKAREDATKARAEEAMLVSVARRNALALNGVTAQVMRGAVALSQKIQVDLERTAREGNMPVKQMLELVRSAAAIARFNAEATTLAVKAERAVLGEPIVTSSAEGSEDGSLDSAVQWIERAVEAVQKARARGVLTSGNGEGTEN